MKRAIQTFFVCLGVAFVALLPPLLERYGSKLPARVRDLKIYGIKALSAFEVKGILDVDIGSPLFGKWAEKASERFKSNPRVASVTVTRNATGDVTVRVSERKAVALVVLDDLYYLDAEGRRLEKAHASAPESLDLPVFTGNWAGRKDAESFAWRWRQGLGLLASLSSEGFKQTSVSELHWDVNLGWVVYRTGSGVRVVMGKEGFAPKAKRLKRVLRDFSGREGAVEEIDLDFSDRAVVKLKKFS